MNLKSLNGLISKLALELHIRNRQVDIVIVQLLENVKGSIVTRISSVGIQRTSRIHGIAEGVDIERTVHSTTHHVSRSSQSTRSLLVTIRAVGQDRNGQLFRQVKRSVHVGSIALNLGVLRPSRIVHSRYRTIQTGFLRTCRNADRMILKDIVVEQ